MHLFDSLNNDFSCSDITTSYYNIFLCLKLGSSTVTFDETKDGDVFKKCRHDIECDR